MNLFVVVKVLKYLMYLYHIAFIRLTMQEEMLTLLSYSSGDSHPLAENSIRYKRILQKMSGS